MNSGASGAGGRPGRGAQQDLRKKMRGWRELLARCGRKPGRKMVHALRVATLRVQAEAEFLAGGLEPESKDARGVRRWSKQGNKLRRALGRLRQADVHLGKLARLRGGGGAGAHVHPECPQECAGEIAELERRIARGRNAAAKRVGAEIERRRKRLERLSKGVEDALASAAPAEAGGSSKAIGGLIAELSGEFGELTAETLHAFRKRIKKTRYLAEIVARGDAEAARQAAALKRMAEAAGEWHDWQMLAEEARRSCGEVGALAGFLEARAGKALERALGVCRRSMAQLLGRAANGNGQIRDRDGDGAAGRAERIARKPVVSAAHDIEGIDKKGSRPAA